MVQYTTVHRVGYQFQNNKTYNEILASLKAIGLSYKGRLRDLGLFGLEKRSFWGDLKMALQYLKGRLQESRKGTLCQQVY